VPPRVHAATVERLEIHLNRPTLIDELLAYLRSLGHTVGEAGYGTVVVELEPDARARLEFHLTIWESVRSLEQPGIHARISDGAPQ
jgi:hypothetical protein